jgi:hypothetical protein
MTMPGRYVAGAEQPGQRIADGLVVVDNMGKGWIHGRTGSEK